MTTEDITKSSHIGVKGTSHICFSNTSYWKLGHYKGKLLVPNTTTTMTTGKETAG